MSPFNVEMRRQTSNTVTQKTYLTVQFSSVRRHTFIKTCKSYHPERQGTGQRRGPAPQSNPATMMLLLLLLPSCSTTRRDRATFHTFEASNYANNQLLRQPAMTHGFDSRLGFYQALLLPLLGTGISVCKLLHVNTPRPRQRQPLAANVQLLLLFRQLVASPHVWNVGEGRGGEGRERERLSINVTL